MFPDIVAIINNIVIARVELLAEAEAVCVIALVHGAEAFDPSSLSRPTRFLADLCIV